MKDVRAIDHSVLMLLCGREDDWHPAMVGVTNSDIDLAAHVSSLGPVVDDFSTFSRN